MKHLIAICLPLILLSAPAAYAADDTGIVGIGVDKETANSIGGWLKTALLGGGGAGGLALWQKLRDKKPAVDPATDQNAAKFDPSKLIDKLKDLLDGKHVDPGPSPSPNPSPLIPTDLKRLMDYIGETKALADDMKTKGTPQWVKAEFSWKDGSGRSVEYGTKTIPAPVLTPVA